MFPRDGRKHPARRRAADPTAPDAMFPHLPRHRADFLREQTVRLLDEQGYATTVTHDGCVELRCVGFPGDPPDVATHRIDGMAVRVLSLHRLSVQIADAGARASGSELLELIRRQIRAVTTGDGTPGPGAGTRLPDADFLRRLRVRLASRLLLEALPGTVDDASRDFTGELRTSLVLNTPDTVNLLDDDALAAHGTATRDQLDDLYRAGYRNTWQELTEAEVTVTPVYGGEPGARYWTVESDAFFLASAPLFLDDLVTSLLPRWVPGVDTTEGVLIAVPARHLMLVRDVTAGEDLMAGITAMSTVALSRRLDSPGPLSPRLHLLHDGAFSPITDVSTDDRGRRRIDILPDPHLRARLEEAPD